MSIESVPPNSAVSGFPELTDLGKRIEMLRIQRGLSKQELARGAGASRQQLWRVSTGKSDLTPALRQRLADVLRVDARELRATAASTYDRGATTAGGRYARGGSTPWTPAAPLATLAEFVGNPAAIASALATLPSGIDGLRLKRALLDAIEDAALDAALSLDAPFFEIRRRVLNGEL